jgi:peptidoglycan hydrolase-like protein with peptidoglycan-binding domain
MLAFGAVLALPGAALAKPASLGSRTLRRGMSGPDVKALQRDLTQVGLKTPAVGSYGPQTQRNVRKFEQEYGLKVDGVATRAVVSELKAALSAGGASTYGSGGSGIGFPSASGTATKKSAKQLTDTPVVKQDGGSQHLGERTLRQGMKGHDVRVLQSYLTLVGYATNVDGAFGPGTQTNVMQFQQSHLLTADGVVTYGVQVVLRQAVAQALAGGAVGKATINSDGTASAPAGAPAVVQKVIAAANQIIDKPYIYAGGHGKWNDSGYDCSGAVSYALHGGGLLSSSEDSTGLESYGAPGPGKWITIYADAAHTWVVVAGIAFDTANFGGPNIPSGTGPRWRRNPTGNLADGGNYVVRHPAGL